MLEKIINLEFDNKLKNLAMCVYQGNESYKPKDWLTLSKFNGKKSFYAESFYKNGVIVISMKGTKEARDWGSNIPMHLRILPEQYSEAQKFYEQTKKDFPNQRIVFTGHSLGGSLAQLMANNTGHEAVTFNAFGVGKILEKNKETAQNIRNYGNIHDKVFTLNLDNHIGETYIISSQFENSYDKKYPFKYHFIENMGDLSDATKYNPRPINISADFGEIFKDVDDERIFTNEELEIMSIDDFQRLENFIFKQAEKNNIMPQKVAEQEFFKGNLIWVDGYIKSDGTIVKGYYRRKPSN